MPELDGTVDTIAAEGSEHCRRAAALPRDERRAAIAAATLPLLIAHGRDVTTRAISEAAGVAEGTIFRVFHDKEAIVRAAVDLAFDPVPIERSLCRIDGRLSLRAQLVEAVKIVQRHMADIGRLVTAVGAPTVFAGRQRPLPELHAVVALFASHPGAVRQEPEEAARLLSALTLAMSHPALIGDRPLTAQEVVSMFLDGSGTGKRRVEPVTRG